MMIGYSNPIATVLRKQCEASAYFGEGILNAGMSMLVEVPLVKCLCVDSRGANFETYAVENCYYFAPENLKPIIFSLVQTSAAQGDIQFACESFLQYTIDTFTTSMDPWFTSQIESATAIGNSLDYLVGILNKDSGRRVFHHLYIRLNLCLSMEKRRVSFWVLSLKFISSSMSCASSMSFSYVSSSSTVDNFVPPF